MGLNAVQIYYSWNFLRAHELNEGVFRDQMQVVEDEQSISDIRKCHHHSPSGAEYPFDTMKRNSLKVF
jgi:hypothetical protein